MSSAWQQFSIAVNGACFDDERDNPLFSESSSLSRNFRTLNTPDVRARLCVLARIADVTGHHLPSAGFFACFPMHFGASRCARPSDAAGSGSHTLGKSGTAHRAALHRTLFGENLTVTNRREARNLPLPFDASHRRRDDTTISMNSSYSDRGTGAQSL